MVPLSLPPVTPGAEANRDRLPVPAAQPGPIFLRRVRAANNKISLQVWQRVALEVRHHFTPGIF